MLEKLQHWASQAFLFQGELPYFAVGLLTFERLFKLPRSFKTSSRYPILQAKFNKFYGSIPSCLFKIFYNCNEDVIFNKSNDAFLEKTIE